MREGRSGCKFKNRMREDMSRAFGVLVENVNGRKVLD